MSKVVKGIGRAISGVVKGVVNVVKDVAKSKLGKILITAAAVYFGGAALMGGASASAAGGSFLSGASAGLSGAASGVSTAWSSLMAGEVGAAGSSLSSGFTGAGAAGAATAAPPGLVTGAMQTGLTSAPGALTSGTTVPGAASLTSTPGALTSGTTVPGAASLNIPASAGLNTAGAASTLPVGSTLSALNTAAAPASSGFLSGLGPYGQYAAISGGTQLIGGAMQGYGAQQEAKRQEKMSADARARYNANVGTRLFS
tara:strand:+ start:801 stop:1571 length:771 start_codon:yes stop_codon:yes gene_type:complete